MSNNLPTAILFDLDDTILDDTGSVERCWNMTCELFAPRIGACSPVELFQAIRAHSKGYWSDPENRRRGRINLNQTRREIVYEALRRINLDIQSLAYEMADFYSERLDEYRVLFPQAVETLTTIREQGVRMAVLTNGDVVVQRAKLVRFNLEHFFDCIVIEGEFGVGKPDLRVYQHALTQLEVQPSETWMVGDNLEWEVAAPQRLGIYSIWNDFERAGLPSSSPVKPDRIIHCLPELLTN